MKTAHNFQVGDSVSVNNYTVPGAPAEWVAGYKVRAVEYEDVVVERNGQVFVIGINRVRAA